MKIIGFFFTYILASLFLVFFSYKHGNLFLDNFFQSGFIETFASIVGLSLACVTFMFSQLISIETIAKKNLFPETKRELKHNSYFILFSFFTVFILSILKPNIINDASLIANKYYYLVSVVQMSLFLLSMFAVYEILFAIFSIKNFFEGIEKK